MAKRTGAARMQRASERSQGSRNQGASSNRGADYEGNEPRGRRRGGGLVAEARGLAQNVGETTVEAAQATAGAARGLASGAADMAGTVASKVRDNPWPSLLIGAGATWLAIDAVRGRSSVEPVSRSTMRRGSERGMVGQAASKVAEVGRAAGEQLEGFVRERPLLAGAATLGLGMAVGMSLPSSVTENRVLGQARDTVVRRAKEAAQETIEKVRDVSDTFERIGPFGGGRGAGSSGRGSRG